MRTTTNRMTAYFREVAADQGAIAAMNGEPWQRCPYPLGSDEHAEWVEAWRVEVARQGIVASRLDAERGMDDSDRRPEPWWPDGLAIAAALFAAVVFAAGCALAGWWIS